MYDECTGTFCKQCVQSESNAGTPAKRNVQGAEVIKMDLDSKKIGLSISKAKRDAEKNEYRSYMGKKSASLTHYLSVFILGYGHIRGMTWCLFIHSEQYKAVLELPACRLRHICAS